MKNFIIFDLYQYICIILNYPFFKKNKNKKKVFKCYFINLPNAVKLNWFKFFKFNKTKNINII